MFNQLSLKSIRYCWILLAILLVACEGTPAPTPIPPTATPLPQSAATSDDEIRTFRIVAEESQASYIVDEEFFSGALEKLGIEAGQAEVVGSTQNIEGQLQLNLADLSASLGTNRFTVDLATLATDQSRRDKWIRENGPEFNQFPLAEFVATSLIDTPATYTEGDEVQFKMSGDLTIRDVTQPVTFEVAAQLTNDTISGIATTQLLLSDFEIEPPSFANTLTVQDAFMIRVEFTAKEE